MWIYTVHYTVNVTDTKHTSFPSEMDSDKDLPDLPYTPMRDGSIDEGATTSSGTDPPDPKRPRAMTAAERKAKSRAAQSAKKKEEDMAKNRTAMESSRRKQSADEGADRMAKNCAAMESARMKQSTEDKADHEILIT